MTWFAKAPSNIALIKYMGKTDPDANVASNSSLSYCLDKLESFVQIEKRTQPEDMWEPLDLPGNTKLFTLPPSAQQRFLDHLAFLKNHFGYSGGLLVRSCNNFPASSGLASSASSFAALTLCATRALCELTEQEEPAIETIAELSRHGSGSSCRSFFKPWALWRTDNGVSKLDLPYNDLIHLAIIVSHEEKLVPSTDAHHKVTTSHLFADRPQRAERRLKLLIDSFNNHDWANAYKIVWEEFWDMHKLFETASEPFSYITPQTQKILNWVQKYWETQNDGPLVTMDAGPNVHLLFRADQAELAMIMKKHFLLDYDII